MSATPSFSASEMVTALGNALKNNDPSLLKIRFADGRSMEFASREEMLNEFKFWKEQEAAETTGGIFMTRLSLKGDN